MRSPTIKAVIATICAIISLGYIITQRPDRQQSDNFFRNPTHNSITTESRHNKLIGVQYALRENNIPQAIHSMPTQTTRDRYNRATLKVLRAQQLLQENNTEQAKQILQEAQADFTQAQNKTTNPYLQAQIRHNQSITTSLTILEQMQTCFDDFGQLLDDLTNINKSIQSIQDSIQAQLTILNDNTGLTDILETDCIEKIKDSMNNSYQTLGQTKAHIQKQNNKYQDIYSQYSQDPSLCMTTNIKPLLRDTQQSQKELESLAGTYALTMRALQIGDPNILTQMCEQAQDDTLGNQSLEQSLQQLLQNLEQSTEQSEQQTNQNQNNNPQNTQEGPSTSTPQYIPLTEEEKIILEQIQKTNTQRLETMMRIRSNNYNPSQTLENIFEIFYPDTSQFTIPGR